MTADANLASLLRRVRDAAAKRGERIVGYYGDLDGHFRFEFAKVKRPRQRATPAPEQPRRVSRGACVDRPAAPQGDLF